MGKKTVYAGRLEAVEALEEIVKREVKEYLIDWTEYDRPALLDEKRTPPGTYYHETRPTGTWLIRPDQAPGSAHVILDYYSEAATAPKAQHFRKIEISPSGTVTISAADMQQTNRDHKKRLLAYTVEGSPDGYRKTIFTPEGKPIGTAERNDAGQLEFYSLLKSIDRREIREIYYRLKKEGRAA